MLTSFVRTSSLLVFVCSVLLVTKPAQASEPDQKLFATPEEAAKALQAAAKASDKAEILAIFGAGVKEIANPDTVEAAKDWKEFAKRCAQFSNVVKVGDSATLYVGALNWPFPIPIKKTAEEKWYFDTAEGKEEILNRRVGENELNIISACREYVDAQRLYSISDHNGDDIVDFAQKIRSTPGKKDGLYWEAKPEEEQSPFGAVVAKAVAEGYQAKAEGAEPQPFHGYYFKILTKQGANAPGGKYDYIINGHMVAGFGLLAYPAKYGNSGVMSFIINQRGKLYEKDLGEKTAELAPAIDAYDPDQTWTLEKDLEEK